MLTVNYLPSITAKRKLFQDDQLPCDASAAAKEIEQKLLAQKQEQWSYDFINDTPTEDEGLWRWNIVVKENNDFVQV